ncbi:4-hydroxy-2-oxoheptanedioate aldolase [Porticoccus sp. GXU_MW_L64]
MIENTFKKRLRESGSQYGLWLGIPDPTCAEICAGAGFDWLLIDAEHAPYDVAAVQRHLQVIQPYPPQAIVRPVEGRTALLKQLLDVGAQTFLVPMVDTADQAEELVQAVNYPPKGIRGLGTSMARAAGYNRVPNYVHKANDQICLLLQVETTKAVENLDSILLVEGVDGIFIGPSDLSASMGYIGQPDHPEVVKAIEQSIQKIIAAGKAPGILSVNPEMARKYAGLGVKFIGVGVDAALLTKATTDLAKQFIGGIDGGEVGY